MSKQVSIGSVIVVEVYLGRVKLDHEGPRRKYLKYERFHGYGNKENYTETYVLVENPSRTAAMEISPDSFIGRALMGAYAGYEVEVNVGGLTVSETRPEHLSGNHLMLKILSVE